MEINSTVYVNSLWESNNLGQNTSISSMMQENTNHFSNGSIDNVNISMLGQLGNAASQISQIDLEEMEMFYQDIIQSIEDGTFDAAESAENAPETLKTFAEENNIDLESLLEEQKQNVEEQHAFMAPPPPPPDNDMQNFMSNLSEDELDEFMDFRTEIIQSVEDGTFDAAESAENAPETLKTFAEENNIDLESLLANWEQETENRLNWRQQTIFPAQILY